LDLLTPEPRIPEEECKIILGLLYDFITPKVTTFFCSWYQVKDGKISSIQTVFDPGAFAAAQ